MVRKGITHVNICCFFLIYRSGLIVTYIGWGGGGGGGGFLLQINPIYYFEDGLLWFLRLLFLYSALTNIINKETSLTEPSPTYCIDHMLVAQITQFLTTDTIP